MTISSMAAFEGAHIKTWRGGVSRATRPSCVGDQGVVRGYQWSLDGHQEIIMASS